MSVTFNVIIDATNATNTDKNAALYAVERENLRRSQQDPPLPLLPTSPNAALFNSYKTVWDENAAPGQHDGWAAAGTTRTDKDRRIAFHAADEATQDAVDDLLFGTPESAANQISREAHKDSSDITPQELAVILLLLKKEHAQARNQMP